MLILPKKQMLEELNESRKGLMDHYNKELESILNENSKKDKYWILGKVRFPEELGGKVGRAFLQACAEKPGLVKDAFLYEVDNTRGVKTLLWVMNPDGSLRLPTLNKTINVSRA
jgi:hypothetical protein